MTPSYRLLALAVRMSCPAGGFLLVTIGSNDASNSTGARRSTSPSTVSPSRNGKRAPAAAAARAAAVNASRGRSITNLRAVSEWYGPVWIHTSLA